MSRASGWDNYGVVGLQRQIIEGAIMDILMMINYEGDWSLNRALLSVNVER
ncbi:unnamed protein product [Camellia sinensis]